MKISTLRLLGTNYSDISTEIKFSLASSRFDGVELIRIEYETNDTDREPKRLYNIVLKALRSLKAHDRIQFFATPDTFRSGKTEGEFLLNKYPEHFLDALNQKENEGYFYIKL